MLTLAAVLASACAPAAPAPTSGVSAPAPEKRAASQVLRVAKVALPGAPTPENSSSNNEIYYTMFDTLLGYGKDFAYRPAVAEKWEYRPADNAWRFTIRKDMSFSNGDKLTADDVAYSANLIVEKKLPQTTFLPSLVSAKKVDDYTVDLFTRGPDATMLDGAPWISIFPAKYHAATGKDFASKPIGSGPYEFVEYKPADILTVKLRSTPHPYRKPVATEIQFKAIPDLSQQIAGLRTGDIDIAQSGFTADQVEQLKKAELNVLVQPSENNIAIYSGPEAEARNTPLKDKRVRLALNYALNREALASTLYKGYADPVGQLAHPGTTFWDPNVKAFPYDPAMAKKLLAEAGYPNGIKLTAGLEFTPQTVSPELAQAIQSALRDIGVDIEIKSYEFATYLDKLYGRNNQQKGDIFMLTGTNSTPNFSWIRGRFDCALEGYAVLFCAKEFNRLYDLAIQESDATKRGAMLRQANQAFRDDVPIMYTVIRSAFLVGTPKVKGLEFTTRSVYDFDNVYKTE